MDINDSAINALCVENGIDPPECIFITAFGECDIAIDAKRTLLIELTTAEVDTTYFLQYDPAKWNPIDFTKSVTRMYGVPDFDRWGEFREDSAMIKPVYTNQAVTNIEFTILYKVIDYVRNKAVQEYGK